MLSSPFICVSCGAPIDTLCTEIKNKKNIKLSRCLRKKCEEVADPYIEREVLLALLDILLLRVEAARHLLINRFHFKYSIGFYVSSSREKEEDRLEKISPKFSTKFYFFYLPLLIITQGAVLKLIFLRDSPFTHQFYPIAIFTALLVSFLEQFLHFFSFIFFYLFFYYLSYFFFKDNKSLIRKQEEMDKVLSLIEKNEHKYDNFIKVLNENSFNDYSSNFSFSINNSVTHISPTLISSSPFNSLIYAHSLSDYTFDSSTHILLQPNDRTSYDEELISESTSLMIDSNKTDQTNRHIKKTLKDFLSYFFLKLPFILFKSLFFSFKSFYFLFVKYNFLSLSINKSIKFKNKGFFYFSLFFSHRILLAFFIPDLVKGLALGIQAFSDPINPRDKPLASSRHSEDPDQETFNNLLFSEKNERRNLLDQNYEFKKEEIDYSLFSNRVLNFSLKKNHFLNNIETNTYTNFNFENISSKGDPAIFLLAFLVMSFQIIAMLAVLPSSTLLEEFHPDLALLIHDNVAKYKLLHDNLSKCDIKLAFKTDDVYGIKKKSDNYEISLNSNFELLSREFLNEMSDISSHYLYRKSDNNDYLKLLAHTFQSLASNPFRLILSMTLSMLLRFFLKLYLFDYDDFIILGGFT